jgi:predicted permease
MQGMLTKEGGATVTKLMHYCFFPALVVTSLGTSVTAETLQSWWPVPVSTLLNVVLGMGLGAAVFPFVGMEAHLRPHFIGCAGAGNLGNLLIVLVPSIASKSSLFNKEDAELGLAYVFTGLFAMCALCFLGRKCCVVSGILAHIAQKAVDAVLLVAFTICFPAAFSELQTRTYTVSTP